jgi:transcriptional regulator with XRE-family HTH domain
MHIGQRIEKRANKLAISAKEIAKACGVSDKAVYQWYNGATKGLKPENLVAVARLLKTTERWLALEDGPEDRPESVDELPPGGRAVVEAWAALPSEHQFAMLEAMKELKRQLDARRWKPSDGERRTG